ncbi:MAG: hypothetical protein AAB263_22395 [Planctomycetota bacterium]
MPGICFRVLAIWSISVVLSAGDPPAPVPKAPATKPVSTSTKPVTATAASHGPQIIFLKTKQRFMGGAMGAVRITFPAKYTLDRDYPVLFTVDTRASFPPVAAMNPPKGTAYISVAMPCPLIHASPGDLDVVVDAVLDILDRVAPNTTPVGSVIIGSQYGAVGLSAMAERSGRLSERFSAVLMIDGGGSPAWMKGKKLFVAGMAEDTNGPSDAKLLATAAQTLGVQTTWFLKGPATKKNLDPDRDAANAAAREWVEGKVFPAAKSDMVATATKHAGDGSWERCLKAWRVAQIMVAGADAGPLDAMLPNLDAACSQASSKLANNPLPADIRNFITDWRGCPSLKLIRERAEAMANDEVDRVLALPNEPMRIAQLQRLHSDWRDFPVTKRIADALEPFAQQELEATKTKTNADQRMKSYRHLANEFAMTSSGIAARAAGEEAAVAELTPLIDGKDDQREAQLVDFVERCGWVPSAPKAYAALAKVREENARELLIRAHKAVKASRRLLLQQVVDQYPGTSSERVARGEIEQH